MYQIQTLNGEWTLKYADGREELGTAEVPGSVLSEMLKKGRIDDPYWRCNEYETRELLTDDFLYEREFDVRIGETEEIWLICEGIDTIADITLNGSLIGHVDDMHRTYRFPVKKFLKEGKNHISVKLYSALAAARKEDEENDIFYASTGCIHGNAAIRKAHYMFGWDWGPQLPDMGIFRNISLEYVSENRFADLMIRQNHDNGMVDLVIETALEKPEEGLTLEVMVESPDGEKETREYPWKEQISWLVEQPELWWPHGVGSQPLYQVTVNLKRGSEYILDSVTKRIGLRTVTVCTDAHEHGNQFAFVVNGVKIFAMGANYIPEDNFLSRISGERTKRLIQDCKKANFNCIRVWGGGYYPDDFFYDSCDEAGILIWQDLMFACNVYALNDHFEENIVEETKDNVKRLRHHACLALWCGNNEMEWGWGDEWARIKGHHPRYKADYTKIFEYILPKVLKSCDDVTFFWPSSPSSGGSYDDPNAVNRGDQHYWEVWHSGKPFTQYRENYFSFCSEYGFQSFPCMKTIESFSLPEDRNVFSRVMESHQKNGAANGKILNYVADYFLYPKSLGDFTYISQVLQLKAIQYGVEHWRRNRGRCMGSLYWQLNDCWPVASWASIDYFGRWKALHYGARRFYAPVMVSACEKEELSTEISYYVNNDTLSSIKGEVKVSLLDVDFKLLHEVKETVEVPPMSVAKSIEIDFAPWVEKGEARWNTFARVALYVDGECISRQTTLFVKPKHFQYRIPQYKTEVREQEDTYEIDISADTFAQYAEISLTDSDGVFSDNYFDITSPEKVRIILEKSELPKKLSVKELEKQLTVRSIADTYEAG